MAGNNYRTPLKKKLPSTTPVSKLLDMRRSNPKLGKGKKRALVGK